MRQLEENVEQSLLREESMLNEGNSLSSDLPADVADLQHTIRELRLKYEVSWLLVGFFVGDNLNVLFLVRVGTITQAFDRGGNEECSHCSPVE